MLTQLFKQERSVVLLLQRGVLIRELSAMLMTKAPASALIGRPMSEGGAQKKFRAREGKRGA